MPLKAAAKLKQLNQLRRQIAIESARLMSEEGIDNFQYARKKAAQRFGINDTHAYPDNKEILAQIKIHQSLYQSSTHEPLIRKLRSTALNAMKMLHDFSPRLTGSVLLGHASEHSGIDIQLMADSPEEIAVLLMEHDIPYQLIDWKLYFSKQKHKNTLQIVPTFQFYAGEHLVNLILLSEKQRKMVPISPENRQTMQRASVKQVEALLAES
ncbi:MAG: hypothetical protein QNL62_05655 [Gammaproteobacteria bacterium]|nr:hypothetical protein [Gammaproteobacteria bacterium]